METLCHKQLRFESLFSKEVIADLEGGQITSDAGGLLLRELDQRCRIAEKTAACLHDPRDAGKVKHDLLTLGRHRLFAIALGYEDNTAATWLVKDPALKTMTGKVPESAGGLALRRRCGCSQSGGLGRRSRHNHMPSGSSPGAPCRTLGGRKTKQFFIITFAKNIATIHIKRISY